MDETKTSHEKSKDKDYKKRRVEEIGSTLAQIKARVKANRSCARKDDDSKASSREGLSEKSEKYIQVLELDKAKAQKLERERPKIKEAIENLMIDRENQKLVEKKIEETRAKQSAPLPEIPIEVQKRISDLEITVHNLRETLSEKERVLESKTESWRLLSDQLEQRNIEVVERYEVMAKEIDEVKKSYGEQEVFLKTELEKCKAKLHHSDSLLISQENLRKSSEEVKTELEKLKSTHSECEAKLEESKKAYESEHRLCLKLQAKIKTYRNQINTKKDECSEVERLKNEIATLEDEKESASRNVIRVKELEEALRSTQVVLSEARQQRDLVNNEYSDLCSKLEMKEEHISMLKNSLEKMEQSKISSEFKAAELEEKMEAENREDRAQNDKMCKEIDNLKQHVKQQEETVEELRNSIALKENEIRMLKESGSMEYSFSYDTQDLKDLLEEWKCKYTKIEETVHAVEEDKENLRYQIQNLQAELDSVNSKSLDIISELSKKEAIIQDHITLNERLTRSLAESSERISELESKLNSNSKTDDQTTKLKKLAANLKIKVKLCKELEDKVTDLTEKLSQHENNITTLTDEKFELENMLSEYKIKLENVSLDSNVVEQLKNLLSEKDDTIQKLIEQQSRRLQAAETAALNRARTESQCEIVEKDTTIKHLKEENLLLESKLNENLTEFHCVGESDTKTDKIESDLTTSGKEELNKSLQDRVIALDLHVESLNSELDNKIKIIEELGSTINELTLQLKNKERSDAETVLDDQTELIKELRAELDSLKNCQESVNTDIAERNYLLEQIKTLQVELQNCHDIIAKKEDMITHFEREISLLKSEVNLNESQMNKIQALYVVEYNKKDGLLTNIETELNLSKNEILILSDQLSEVTRNYDQCYEKLKEKDEYIDKLQKDLDSMKSRVENLQSSIAERQKSMEKKAEQLGEKLNEASFVNMNFEKYRIDTEQKLVKSAENEKQLNRKINELLQDIDVLKASNEEFTKINEALASNKKTQEIKVNELESELNDIKSAYNTTLDQIELLNEELKQVMSQIEFRNQELVRIGEERNSLIGRMSELEDTCSQLRSQLQQNQQQSESLKTELDYKLKELDVATAEITHLQNQLGTSQLTDGVELNKELEVLKKEYEERLRELQLEKEDLMKVIKGTVASEVDSVMKAAEDQIENKNEIKLFSWKGHTESNLGIDDVPLDELQDDGWGWNSSDAKLEEEYQNSEANKVRQMSNEILQLKSVNSTLEEEVKLLKIKCSKLVAKVKELKAASEKEKSKTGFEDLNFAMQEEMRSQVDELDKKNKELSADMGTMKIEKERLLKRIETLTSANNQLIEMKERQDIEVQVWQRNCADLKFQLQSFDWNESDIKPQAQPAQKELTKNTNSELEDKLTFLETENEELLQIICSLKDEKQSNSNLNIELSNIKEENRLLKESALNRNQNEVEVNDLKQLLDSERLELQNKISLIDQINQEKCNLEVELNQMKQEFMQAKEKYDTLSDQMNNFTVSSDQIKSDYDSLKSEVTLKNSDIINLTGQVNSLQETVIGLNLSKEQLELACFAKDGEISELKERLSQLDTAILQIQEMQNEQMQLSSEIERLQAVIQTLSEDNSKLSSSYESKLSEVELLKADMKMLEACKDSAIIELNTLREELINVKSHGDSQKTENKLYEPPSACSMFKDVSATPSIFQMPVPEAVIDNVFSSTVKTVSTPVDCSSDKCAPNQSKIPESPPVFRGFFSNQNDTFSSSLQQQFDIDTESKVIPSSSQDVLDIAFKSSTPSDFNPVDIDLVECLNSTVMKLKEKFIASIRQWKSLSDNNDLDRDLFSKLDEIDSEITVLHDQISQLNQQVRSFSVNLESEKSELLITNQELLKKISEYENSLKSQREEIEQLKSELEESRRFYSNESEKKINEEARRRHESETEQLRQKEMRALQESLEEQLRHTEKNFQNLILSKDEENAHLTCEVSAKESACNKLTLQLEELNKQIRGLENEIKASSDRNESLESQMNSFKRDVELLNLENSELRKVKENESQLYVAQVDYLQQSLQEKDASLETLNSSCNHLQQQLSALHQQYEAATVKVSYLEECYSSLNATHAQLLADYNAVEDRLRSADSEIARLNSSLSSLTVELDEHRNRLERVQISNESLKSEESQRLSLLTAQIELLQSSVTEKDLEIERLSKLLTGLQEKLIKVEESKITDDVVRLRRKLDESLYTLHLRDVRCDELTVEIMQLLEERDSLQLRLSEAIRECESLRAGSSTALPNQEPSTETLSSLPHSKSSQHLHNKIGELHTGYMKDPTVQMERENRYTQQMQLFTSPDCESGSEQVKTDDTVQSDYGLLNWFFSSRTSPQPSQEPGS